MITTILWDNRLENTDREYGMEMKELVTLELLRIYGRAFVNVLVSLNMSQTQTN